MLCANNTTISNERGLQKFGSSLPLGEQRGSKHGTKFQIPPLQRQGVCSGQYCDCHTGNFPNKATTPSKPQNLHWIFWCVLTSHWKHFQFVPVQLQPIHTPSPSNALQVNFSIFIFDCKDQGIISIHQFVDFSFSGWCSLGWPERAWIVQPSCHLFYSWDGSLLEGKAASASWMSNVMTIEHRKGDKTQPWALTRMAATDLIWNITSKLHRGPSTQTNQYCSRRVRPLHND